MIASAAILATAAALAGSPVHVTCDTRAAFDQIAADADYDPDWVGGLGAPGRVWLRQHDCRTMNRIVAGKRVPRWRAASAILTFGHEIGHARGISSEKVANQYGARVSKRIARELGHPRPFRVRALAWVYARNSEEGI